MSPLSILERDSTGARLGRCALSLSEGAVLSLSKGTAAVDVP